jgi:hypothetical protein
MKRTIFLLLISALLFAQDAPTTKPEERYPAAKDAVYFKDLQKGWVQLEKSPNPEWRTTGTAKMAFSYGIAKMRMKYQFAGAEAPVKVVSAASFYLSNVPFSRREIILLKLQKHGDRREVEFSSANVAGGTYAYRGEDLVEADVTSIGDDGHSFTVVPKRPLNDGEYVITITPPFPMQPNAFYDFGVKTSK